MTRHGYTDHQELDSVNLIHMNGRVYDPVIGRFQTRDPFIDGVESSQGPNGYAYVWNNPLSRWDPTGYELENVDVWGRIPPLQPAFPEIDVQMLRQWGIYIDPMTGLETLEVTASHPTGTNRRAGRTVIVDAPRGDPCGGTATSEAPAEYADYVIVTVGVEVSPILFGASYSMVFLWNPASTNVLSYWSVSAGLGLGLSAGGSVQIGNIGLGSPSDITGFGLQSSGFLAWGNGVAATGNGGLGNLPLFPGPVYSGGSAGPAYGAGASMAAEVSYTRYMGQIDFSRVPKNVQTALCSARRQP